MNLEKFENKLTDWGFGYPEWAGCRLIQDENVRVKDDVVYAESDCIMVDERCNEGTFGISHEEPTVLYTIELKKPKKFGVDYQLKQKQRAITTYELIERYFWMSDLFTDWEHVKTAGANNYNDWENAEDITQCFETEITQLQDDPWLAMYWLLHLGLTCDNRYEIIKTKTLELNLAEQLPDIADCIAWFDAHDAFYKMQVMRSLFSKHSKDTDDLFLIRRAFLLFLTHSYQNAGGETAFDKWWLSIKIYPKAEEYMIRRMRWLWRNLDEFNQWDAFDEQLKNENPEEIALLSYVQALNPHTDNKTPYADTFIAELDEYKTCWTDDTAKSFAKAMIAHLKDWYSDTDTLKNVMQYYFIGDTQNADYLALQQQYFNNEAVILDVSEELTQLGGFFYKGVKNCNPEKEKDVADFTRAMTKAKALLATLNEAQISAMVQLAIANTYKNENAIYVLIEHLFENDIKDKKSLLLMLFSNGGAFQCEMFKIFLQTIIKDENDSNIPIILALIDKTESKWTDTLPYVFINTLQFAPCFDWFVSLFEQIEEQNDKPSQLTELISRLYRKVPDEYGYDERVSVFAFLDKAQIERLFTAIFATMVRLHKAGQWIHDVLNLLSEAAHNPLAKEWVENFLQDYQTYESHFANDDGNIVHYLKERLRTVCYYLKIEDKTLTQQLEKE